MSNRLNKRIERLEVKASGPALLVVWDEMTPDCYQAERKEYPSLEAVEAAYPGRDITLLEIVYSDATGKSGPQ